ncbi:nucleotidyl transferase AbiEii/AbiGii toxin family protein [Limnohabitans sp.]|uniref:nucleotidyl transferase AbiEii/AbiGii toxin family protein n=1 Tax=Limnohabitans sp. TaxID=1907725 RepID=UPI00286EFE98|nr:nucleotidyl transferase AbiEii/AbiGii toxin family protein [Limnohabitans sp.]
MLKLDFMPEATRQCFARLKKEPRLAGFTLVGGTALALQIGHRMSEDLDFNIFGQTLPKRAIDGVLNDLAAGGAAIESLITAAQKSKFKINTAEHLDDYVQDYLIDGAKLTFHARHERDRPKTQIDFLKSTKKLKTATKGFDVLGLDGLFVMKSIVVYDRVKSRDIYDLMVLMRDHGYALADALAAIDAYQPARDKDPEHFKSVVTGNIPLDANDEGFASIHLNVKMQDVYRYFKKSMDAYEIDWVKAAVRAAAA